MALHIGIFILLFGVWLWEKMQLPLFSPKRKGFSKDAAFRKKALRLFFLAALAGNILGLFLTMKEVKEASVPLEKLEKSRNASREELVLSVDEEEKTPMEIRVPPRAEPKEGKENDRETQEPEKGGDPELLEAIRISNEECADPDYYYLPDTWGDKALLWTRKPEKTGNILAALCLLAGVLLLVSVLSEPEKERKRKAEELLLEYPGFIMNFSLFVRAGMTTREAFRRMGSAYQKEKKAAEEEKTKGGIRQLTAALFSGKAYGAFPRLLYEEVLSFCNEIDSGVPESDAWTRFGERCAVTRYRMFAVLLTQNLHKGSSRLLEMLERESLEAWEERKRKARVLGETAQTKLLLPMIMLMTLVMLLILIPAFLTFYGI